MSRFVLPLAPLLLALLAPNASAELWIVDQAGGPGADFATIQAAIDAAGPGDVVLVRPTAGIYSPFAIDGKGLSVVAEESGTYVVKPLASVSAIHVRNVPAGQQALVRGFALQLGVDVQDCSGSVWFEDIEVSGFQPISNGIIPGARVERSPAVTFEDCCLTGSTGTVVTGAGLWSDSATVQLFDCTILGGAGVNALGSTPDGGPGAVLMDTTVTLAGCTVTGGPGAQGFGDPCVVDHGVGGTGVEFVGSGAVLRLLETPVDGGALDLTDDCGTFGPAGPDLVGVGTIQSQLGVAHHLDAPTPTKPGNNIVFTCRGIPGEIAAVLVSTQHAPFPFPAPAGVLLPGLPGLIVLNAGVIDGAGQAQALVPAPSVGPSGHLVAYAQAAFVDASPASWLGSGSAILVVSD